LQSFQKQKLPFPKEHYLRF